ncbi:MAG: GTPase HflX [Candidatus Krumholzibacteriota bacterium]
MMKIPEIPDERALLIGVKLPGSTMAEEEANLRELRALTRSAGAAVAGTVIQQMTRINGSTYIGKGKLEEAGRIVREEGVNLVVFDDTLSPAQGARIEKILDVNVLDRTEIILDIFSRRARSKQAKIQVEIAQLTYALPRLKRLWDHLSRQAGGIGTRGPGETQLEVDRRRVRERIRRLKRELERINRSARERRKRRKDAFNVTIVGYTNAGKSTLLNRISGSAVYQSGTLFSTLDSTTRRVERAGRADCLFTDTVGFIRKLPPDLVASFKSTLMDVEEADLLIHVVDASASGIEEKIEVVNGVLKDIFSSSPGGEEVPTWLVMNKTDVIDRGSLDRLRRRYESAVFLSAATGEGVERLMTRVDSFLRSGRIEIEVTVPLSEGKTIALVEEAGEVLSREVRGETLVITALIKRQQLKLLEKKGEVRVNLSGD